MDRILQCACLLTVTVGNANVGVAVLMGVKVMVEVNVIVGVIVFVGLGVIVSVGRDVGISVHEAAVSVACTSGEGPQAASRS